ncbi:MAG TPA: hypothetical protein VNH44_01850 [Micropepsaceae bacterium]|nr:hypothetical protein [Micropepsaceae bacterium]
MKSAYLIGVLLASGLAAGVALAQNSQPKDEQPMTVDGVETVCTGSSSEVRADPQWRSYPFHLEVAGKDGQYLGDEKVTVSGNGHSVSVQCSGPWVLMKLPAGDYKVSLDVPDAGHKDVTVKVPGRTVVNFPQAGGAEAPHG